MSPRSWFCTLVWGQIDGGLYDSVHVLKDNAPNVTPIAFPMLFHSFFGMKMLYVLEIEMFSAASKGVHSCFEYFF